MSRINRFTELLSIRYLLLVIVIIIYRGDLLLTQEILFIKELQKENNNNYNYKYLIESNSITIISKQIISNYFNKYFDDVILYFLERCK